MFFMGEHAFAFLVTADQTPTVHPSVPARLKAESERTLPPEGSACMENAHIPPRVCAGEFHVSVCFTDLCVLCVHELQLLFPRQWLSVEKLGRAYPASACQIGVPPTRSPSRLPHQDTS